MACLYFSCSCSKKQQQIYWLKIQKYIYISEIFFDQKSSVYTLCGSWCCKRDKHAVYILKVPQLSKNKNVFCHVLFSTTYLACRANFLPDSPNKSMNICINNIFWKYFSKVHRKCYVQNISKCPKLQQLKYPEKSLWKFFLLNILVPY